LYAGGLFNAASNVPNTLNIARWNGSSWSALGSVTVTCTTIALGADGMYVGGLFNAAGGKASRFGLWHGSVAVPANPDDVYWDSRFGGASGGWQDLCCRGERNDVYVGEISVRPRSACEPHCQVEQWLKHLVGPGERHNKPAGWDDVEESR
jgi:hypothetical protein